LTTLVASIPAIVSAYVFLPRIAIKNQGARLTVYVINNTHDVHATVPHESALHTNRARYFCFLSYIFRGAGYFLKRRGGARWKYQEWRGGENWMVVKIIMKVYAKEGMSKDEFVNYWLTKHAPLAKQKFGDILKKYVISIVMSAEGEEPGYQGTAELWFGCSDTDVVSRI
jgi:hypothetical protein